MVKSEEAGLELLVVSAVVARVVLALLQSASGFLWYEAAGVVTLTVFALNVELFGRKQHLDHLMPRSSLSSGILLGAITVPMLLSTRLMQLQRCCSSKSAQIAFERMRIDFWLSLACSMSMILLVMSFLWKQKRGNWIGLSIFEYTSAFVLVSVTLKQQTRAWGGIDLVRWSCVYVLGGKALFAYVLKVFPYTGTVGEVMLVVEGIVLYGADAVGSIFSPTVELVGHDSEQEIINVLLQGLILSIVLVPPSLSLLHHILPSVFGPSKDRGIPQKQSRETIYMICRAGSFYFALVVVVFAAIPGWLGLVTGVNLSPVIWTTDFVFQQPVRRLLLCVYWIVIICTPLRHLYRISAAGLVPKILVRKYYHVMAVFMFIPALILEPRFLQLAFGVALAGFLVIEMTRVWRTPPFGHFIERFMTVFTDHRDSGTLIISHFSLLLGCALPVWLNSGPGDRPLASLAGIISLGVGDTMASVVGYKHGSIRVSPNSRKTLEGTLAGIGSMLISFLFLIQVLPPVARPAGLKDYFSLLVAVTGAGVLEAYTLQLDNAFMPLLFYVMLCL